MEITVDKVYYVYIAQGKMYNLEKCKTKHFLL